MSFWGLSWQAVILHYQVNCLQQLQKLSWMIFCCRHHRVKSRNPFTVVLSGKIEQDKSLCMAGGLNYQTIPSKAENPVSENPGKY